MGKQGKGYLDLRLRETKEIEEFVVELVDFVVIDCFAGLVLARYQDPSNYHAAFLH